MVNSYHETDRQRKNALLNQMKQERTSFVAHWRDLSDYIAPRRGRFFVSDRNRGEKRNQKIIDNTATLAARTFRAGLTSGITSAARPWFVLTTPDPDLSEFAPVKRWLNDVTTLMRTVFLKSNLYQALPLVYGDEGVYGTGCMALMEDDDDVIRCYTFPIGSYMLAQDHRGLVDTFAREYSMTVRQLVEKFGRSKVSVQTGQMWDQGNREKWVEVVHLIQKNPDYDPQRVDSKYKRFLSCYYEKTADDGQYLRESGFDEFPIMAPRWDLTGEDIYGTSPGMEALGDVKMLQTQQKRKLMAIDKMVNPAMTAPTSLMNKKTSILPGDVTYVDATQGQQGFTPAHEVRLDINHLKEDIRETQIRIARAFYEDLFLMLAQSDRREITAREIEERHEEKLLMLGPALERQNEDLLDPLIDRTFSILLRRGMVPTPPQELQGVDLKVEYISIMAQAQKMVATGGIERFAQFVGGIGQIKPNALDKLDEDQAIDEYGDMLGVSPKIIRTDKDVAEIRQQRAQQQAAMEQAAMAEQAANTGKTLSETNTSGDNALTQLAAAVG